MTSEDHPERLLIALEPEAASVYVRKLRLYQLVPDTWTPAQTQTLGSGTTARHSYYVSTHTTATSGTPLRCCRQWLPSPDLKTLQYLVKHCHGFQKWPE